MGHPKPGSVPRLRARGFEILDENSINREELISFFDYDELREGSWEQMRDYLCFGDRSAARDVVAVRSK